MALLILLFFAFYTIIPFITPSLLPSTGRWSVSLLLAAVLSRLVSPPSPSLSATTITVLRTGGVSVSLHRIEAAVTVDAPVQIPDGEFIPIKDLKGLIVNEAFEGVTVETYLAFVVINDGAEGEEKEERLVVASPRGAKERDVTKAYGVVRDWMDANGILLDR